MSSLFRLMTGASFKGASVQMSFQSEPADPY